jgi:hypothetical protein
VQEEFVSSGCVCRGDINPIRVFHNGGICAVCKATRDRKGDTKQSRPHRDPHPSLPSFVEITKSDVSEHDAQKVVARVSILWVKHLPTAWIFASAEGRDPIVCFIPTRQNWAFKHHASIIFAHTNHRFRPSWTSVTEIIF